MASTVGRAQFGCQHNEIMRGFQQIYGVDFGTIRSSDMLTIDGDWDGCRELGRRVQSFHVTFQTNLL